MINLSWVEFFHTSLFTFFFVDVALIHVYLYIWILSTCSKQSVSHSLRVIIWDWYDCTSLELGAFNRISMLLSSLSCFSWSVLYIIYQWILIVVSLCVHSPVSPDAMDWRALFPAFYSEKTETEGSVDRKCSKVEFADIGCGYGGLLGNETTILFIINTVDPHN